MHISDTEQFKIWLTSNLEPICDADPSALAKYIIALLKKDKSVEELKLVCVDQLKVFLNEATQNFINSMFNVLESKAYTVQDGADSKTMKNESSNQEVDERESLKNETAKQVDDLKDSEEDMRSSGEGHDNITNKTSPQQSPGERHVQPRISNSNSNRPRYDAQSDQRDATFRNRNNPKGGGGVRRNKCRDFDEKGFCTRGANCPYEHGHDMLVVNEKSIPNIFNLPMNIPGFPCLPLIPPPDVLQKFINNDLFNKLLSHNQMVYNLANNQKGGTAAGGGGGGSSVSFPLTGGESQNYDQCSNISSVSYPLQSNSNSATTTGGGGNSNSNSSYVGEQSRFRRYTDSYDMKAPNLVAVQKQRSNQNSRSLILKKVPAQHTNAAAVNNYFSQFGKVTNVLLTYGGDPSSILVEFSTHHEAKKAHDSPQAIFGNRFIRVYFHNNVPLGTKRPLSFHRDMDSSSQLPFNSTNSASANTTTLNNGSENNEEPRRFPTPQQLSYINPEHLEKEEKLKKERLIAQSEAEEKRKHLLREIDEKTKYIMGQLRSALSQDERDSLSKSLKDLMASKDALMFSSSRKRSQLPLPPGRISRKKLLRSPLQKGAFRLDNRPKAIVVSLNKFSNTTEVLSHFEGYGKVEFSRCEDMSQLVIGFSTHAVAAKALEEATLALNNRIKDVSWYYSLDKPKDPVSTIATNDQSEPPHPTDSSKGTVLEAST